MGISINRSQMRYAHTYLLQREVALFPHVPYTVFHAIVVNQFFFSRHVTKLFSGLLLLTSSHVDKCHVYCVCKYEWIALFSSSFVRTRDRQANRERAREWEVGSDTKDTFQLLWPFIYFSRIITCLNKQYATRFIAAHNLGGSIDN